MLVHTYLVKESANREIKEFYCLWHEGSIRYKAQHDIEKYCSESGTIWSDNIDEMLKRLRHSPIPPLIFTKKDGKYEKVARRLWPGDIKLLLEAQEEGLRILDETKKKIYS